MSELVQHAEGLWTVSAPHRFFGLELGTRMTVIRLPGDNLWLHSVVAVDDFLADEIQALGQVRHIVMPDLYHHMYVSDAIQRWSAAKVFAPAAMRQKRPELRIDSDLSETADPSWCGELVPVHIDGSALDETVFLHRPSRTLVCADLVENFDSSPHFATRLYLKAAGLEDRVAFSRLLRPVYRDRRAAWRSLQRLQALDFDRVVLAHGRVLEHGGPAAVREAYRWLEPASATGG
jgi:glyoxylase-like metal-dependent hydrolase (beta-lactamase superfamily II)